MNTELMPNNANFDQAQMLAAGTYDVITPIGNSVEEYAAIRGSVAIFDFSTHGQLRISGDDHIAWVSRLVSRDLEFLNSETATFALCLNEQADVLGIITLYKFDDYILIETETAERDLLAAWFAQHHEEGIEIENVSEKSLLLGLEGPAAFKVVQTLLDYEVSSIAFQGFVEVEYQGEMLLLARTGYTGEYGYKLVAPASIARQLWDELHRQVKELGGQQCGTEILATTMLEIRQPINGLETSACPVISAGLGWLIDFNKAEDYSGKDAVLEQCSASLSHRTIGFIADAQAQIKIGASIVLEDQVIGSVLAIFYSPTLNAQLGLAYNIEPFTVPDLTWNIQDEQGNLSSAHSVSSPYIVPQSWKMKML
jgi:glycine cleavage system aminomethyltransferase T